MTPNSGRTSHSAGTSCTAYVLVMCYERVHGDGFYKGRNYCNIQQDEAAIHTYVSLCTALLVCHSLYQCDFKLVPCQDLGVANHWLPNDSWCHCCECRYCGLYVCISPVTMPTVSWWCQVRGSLDLCWLGKSAQGKGSDTVKVKPQDQHLSVRR